MANLNRKIGEMSFDGLITQLIPPVQVRGRTIRKLSAAATLKRGTIMAISSTDGKLVMLGTDAASGETLTPDCILTDDIEVGTDADINAAVYTAGCFDVGKCTVAEDYTVTAADYDALRVRDIVFHNSID